MLQYENSDNAALGLLPPLRPHPTAGSLICMATDAATPPPPHLPALYRAALRLLLAGLVLR